MKHKYWLTHPCTTYNDILYTYLRNCPSYIIFIETFPHTTLANSFLNSANPLFSQQSQTFQLLQNFFLQNTTEREKEKPKRESWKHETLEKNNKKFKKNNQNFRKLLKSQKKQNDSRRNPIPKKSQKMISKNSKRDPKKDLEESRSRIIASQRERERSGKPQKKEKKRKRITKNLERT